MPKGEFVQIDTWKKKMHDFLKEQYEKYLKGERSSRDYAGAYSFLKTIAKRRDAQRDAVIALTGPKGEGKSNTGVYFSMVLSYMLKIDFDLQNNIFYTYDVEEATKKITATSSQIYFFDEAIDAMSGADATTRISKFLAKVFVKSRKLKHIIFLAMPKMWMFSKIFRADLIHFRLEHAIRTKRFARVALMAPDRNPDNPDPWFLDWKARRYMRHPVRYTKRDILSRLQKDPNFVAWMRVPPLPKPIEHIYIEESTRALARMSDRAKLLI